MMDDARADPVAAATSPSFSKRKKRRPNASATVTLLPITPQHRPPQSALEVDASHSRVVYLAPLTTVATEKFFARNAGRAQSDDEWDGWDEDDDSGEELDLAEDAAGDSRSQRRKLWHEAETALVDAANDEFDKRQQQCTEITAIN
ncbi:hypothetical protein P43SY_003988 [Pythium insidiosum]|uniref:Uncharacterized protein n=1 Tax=Pythium insidiosum TaxID=114742 RepID=A0AAD5QA28_PYTIN|nr:hypothetical protein P43SY_003988 [Pythium insidiosum]